MAGARSSWRVSALTIALGLVAMDCRSPELDPGATHPAYDSTDDDDDDDDSYDGEDDGDDDDADESTEPYDPTCWWDCPPDNGPPARECDPWAQDCPAGEKCMPWAIDGGSALDGTRCTPVAKMPRELGDTCEVEGLLSGIDNCAAGMICWDVDPATSTGVCVEMCIGSSVDPVCVDPTTECFVEEDELVIACLAPCDPLLQDCVEGKGCYPADSGFTCRVASEPGYGEPCETYLGCSAGHVCVVPQRVFGCEGELGCCADFCYLAAGDPDELCEGAADGHTCWPLADGHGPPGVAVGICMLPP